MKQFLHILTILSLVLMGVSPACKFISGQAQTIEICTHDGVKTISIADGQQQPAQDQHKKQDDCGFCFAQSHLTLAKAVPPVVVVAASHGFMPAVFTQGVFVSRFELSSIVPRGPPFFQA